MPRDFRAAENQKRLRAARDRAMARRELGTPSEPRASAAGPTAMAVKTIDDETRRLIDDAIAARTAKRAR